MFKQLKGVLVLLCFIILFSCSNANQTNQTRPTATIKNVELVDNQIIFDIELNDTDDLIIDAAIELKKGSEVVNKVDIELLKGQKNYTLNDLHFDALEPDVLYHLDLVASYKYGTETVTEVIATNEIRTDNYLPSGTISNISLNNDKIVFDFVVTDPYNIVNKVSVLLIKGDINDQEVVLGQYQQIELSDLEEDQSYTLLIIGEYTVNHQTFEKELDQYEFTTPSWVSGPSGEIIEAFNHQDILWYDVNIIDEDETIQSIKALLTSNGLIIKEELLSNSAGYLEELSLGGLTELTEYKLEIIVIYVIGEIEYEVVLDTYDFITEDWTMEPQGGLENISLILDTITFDIPINDSDEVISSAYVVLSKNHQTIATIELTNLYGVNEGLVFSDLERDTSYQIEVLYIDFYTVSFQTLDLYTFTTENWFFKPTGELLNINNVNADITFDVSIYDVEQSLTNLWVILKLNDIIIDDIAILDCLIDDACLNIQFMNLHPNTTYTLELLANYQEGTIHKSDVLDVKQFTTGVWGGAINPTDTLSATITNVNVDKGTIQFDSRIIDYNQSLVAIQSSIKDGSEIVASTDLNRGENQIQFFNVPVNKAYTLQITAITNGSTLVLAEVPVFVPTWGSIPEASSFNTFTQGDTYYFDVLVTDYDQVIKQAYVGLYYEDYLISTINLTEGYNLNLTFTPLLKEKQMCVKLIVIYNIGYGDEEVILEYTDVFSNYGVSMPSASIDQGITSTDYYQTELSVSDESSLITDLSVILYDHNGNIIESIDNGITVGLNNLEFNHLIPNTVYTLKVLANFYNMNDYELCSTQFTTLPTELTVTDFTSFTTAVNTDGTIDLAVYLDNPLNLNVTALYINGTKYSNFLSGSTSTRIFVRINSGNVSGYVPFVLEKLEINYQDTKGEYQTNEQVEVTVLKPIDIISITTDSSYYHFNQNIIISFKIIKEAGYAIDQLVFNNITYPSSSFITNTDTEISIMMTAADYSNIYQYDLNSITYTYLGETLSTDLMNQTVSLYVGDTGNIHYIYNVTDLININHDGINILMNDIDLQGINWEPLYLGIGYLNGNGYRIDNLNISEIRNSSTFGKRYGLLYANYGLIENVTLTNVHIDVFDIGTAYANAGSIAGYNEGTIRNSSASGLISGEQYVGGLVGDNQGIIQNCYASVEVNGINSVGGIAGRNYKSIHSVYSTGHITSQYGAGGLVGEHNNGEISNSFSTSNIYSDHNFVGNLIHFHPDLPHDIYNSYRFENQIISVKGGVVRISDSGIKEINVVTTIELNDPNWYRNHLLFDDTIWDLTNVYNGLPTLK